MTVAVCVYEQLNRNYYLGSVDDDASILAGEIRILTRNLLSTTPPRITKQVDVLAG